MEQFASRRRQLQDIIDRNNDRHAVKPKSVGSKTRHERAIFLHSFFEELWCNEQCCYKVLPDGLRIDPYPVHAWSLRGAGTVARDTSELPELSARFCEVDRQERNGPQVNRVRERSCAGKTQALRQRRP